MHRSGLFDDFLQPFPWQYISKAGARVRRQCVPGGRTRADTISYYLGTSWDPINFLFFMIIFQYYSKDCLVLNLRIQNASLVKNDEVLGLRLARLERDVLTETPVLFRF